MLGNWSDIYMKTKTKNNDRKKGISKIKIIILIFMVILIISGVILSILFKDRKTDKNNNSSLITYNQLETIMDKKETGVIYYYNSNKDDVKIKNYLDELGIKYYLYDNVKISEEEYNNLLKLINVDRIFFTSPALIYVKDGIAYGYIINIDNLEKVKQFVDMYNLYIFKVDKK